MNAAATNANRNQTRPIQMNLKLSTIEQLGEIKETLNSPNRTTAAKSAFDIATLVLNQLQAGGSVELVDANGNRREIVIPGVSR